MDFSGWTQLESIMMAQNEALGGIWAVAGPFRMVGGMGLILSLGLAINGDPEPIILYPNLVFWGPCSHDPITYIMRAII